MCFLEKAGRTVFMPPQRIGGAEVYMDIKREIELIGRLNLATNRLNGAYYIWARRHRMSENMLTLLYALGDGKPHTQREISRDWLIPKTTVNTLTKDLVANGYAALCGDRREKRIELTASGLAFAEDALGKLYLAELGAMENTLAAYPAAFVDALEKYTAVIAENLNAQTAEQE